MNRKTRTTLTLHKTTLKSLNGGQGNMEFDDDFGGSGSGSGGIPASSLPAFSATCNGKVRGSGNPDKGLKFAGKWEGR